MARQRDHCPICGVVIQGADEAAHARAWAAHRCHPRVLSAIDGAHGRDDDPDRSWPGESRRLFDGLRWREQDDDPDFDGRDRPQF